MKREGAELQSPVPHNVSVFSPCDKTFLCSLPAPARCPGSFPQLPCLSSLLLSPFWLASGRAALVFCEQNSFRGPKWDRGRRRKFWVASVFHHGLLDGRSEALGNSVPGEGKTRSVRPGQKTVGGKGYPAAWPVGHTRCLPLK